MINRCAVVAALSICMLCGCCSEGMNPPTTVPFRSAYMRLRDESADGAKIRVLGIDEAVPLVRRHLSVYCREYKDGAQLLEERITRIKQGAARVWECKSDEPLYLVVDEFPTLEHGEYIYIFDWFSCGADGVTRSGKYGATVGWGYLAEREEFR